MILSALLLVIGVASLYFGAEWLVRGAARIASALRVSPLVIGLTVVAFGTSLPEMLACVVAAWQGATDIALGNVVGSNIANIGLILGLSAIMRPLAVSLKLLQREVPLMIAATLLLYGLAWMGVIGPFVGVALFVGLIAFTWLSLRAASAESRKVRREFERYKVDELNGGEQERLARDVALVIVGLIALVVGAKLLVDAAVQIARALGVSEFAIAVSMVAVGTSLPELATSIVAALRRENDVLVGNIVGSNIFNILGALGLAAIVHPIPVNPAFLGFEFLALVFFTLAMAWVLQRDRVVVRAEGIFLFVAYLVYIVVLFGK